MYLKPTKLTDRDPEFAVVNTITKYFLGDYSKYNVHSNVGCLQGKGTQTWHLGVPCMCTFKESHLNIVYGQDLPPTFPNLNMNNKMCGVGC